MAFDLIDPKTNYPVGFLVQKDAGWQFISNVSDRPDGSTFHDLASEAIPEWCRHLTVAVEEARMP